MVRMFHGLKVQGLAVWRPVDAPWRLSPIRSWRGVTTPRRPWAIGLRTYAEVACAARILGIFSGAVAVTVKDS